MRNRLQRFDRAPGASWWMQQARQAALDAAPVADEAAPPPRQRVIAVGRVVSAQDQLPRYAGMTTAEIRAVVRRAVASGAFKYPARFTPPN